MSRTQVAFLVFYAATVAFWVGLTLSDKTDTTYNYIYSLLFGLIPLGAGAIAMLKSKLWGGLASAMGRAVFFLALGLFFWGAGEMVWSYYNFAVAESAPYPSLADIGFGPSIFFWIIGVLQLSKASGAKFGLRNAAARIFAVVAPIVLAAVSYYLLVVVARGGAVTDGQGGTLKVILDIIYPLGDLLAMVVAVVIYALSRRYLGGQYKLPILTILFGLAVMYFGDFLFSYTTTVGSYYNGDWGDLILATGLTFLGIGTLGLAVRPRVIARKKTA